MTYFDPSLITSSPFTVIAAQDQEDPIVASLGFPHIHAAQSDFKSLQGTDIRQKINHFIENGNIEGLKILPKDVYLNLGFFPIQTALQKKQIDIAKMFLEWGCQVSQVSFDFAIQNEIVEIVKSYLSAQPAFSNKHAPDLPSRYISDIDLMKMLLGHGYKATTEALERAKTFDIALLLLQHKAPVTSDAVVNALENNWDPTPFLEKKVQLNENVLALAIKRNLTSLCDRILQQKHRPVCFYERVIESALQHNRKLIPRLITYGSYVQYEDWGKILQLIEDSKSKKPENDCDVFEYEEILTKTPKTEYPTRIAIRKNYFFAFQELVKYNYPVTEDIWISANSQEAVSLLLEHKIPANDNLFVLAFYKEWDWKQYIKLVPKTTSKAFNKAIELGKTDFIEFVFNLDQIPSDYETLDLAIKHNLKIVPKLLQSGTLFSDLSIFMAILYNVEEEIFLEMIRQKKPQSRDLKTAAEKRNLHFVKMIVKEGVEVDVSHLAAACERLEDQESLECFYFLLPLYKGDLQKISWYWFQTPSENHAIEIWRKLHSMGVKPSTEILEYTWRYRKLYREIINIDTTLQGPRLSVVINDYPDKKNSLHFVDRYRLTINFGIVRDKKFSKIFERLCHIASERIAKRNPHRFEGIDIEDFCRRSIKFLSEIFKDDHNDSDKDLVLFLEKCLLAWKEYGDHQNDTPQNFLLFLLMPSIRVWNWAFPSFDTPKQIAALPLWGFNLGRYRSILQEIIPLCKREKNTDKEIAAYKLSILFETLQEAMGYLAGFKAKYPNNRQPVHDATLFELPKSGFWDIQLWRKLMKKFGYKYNRLRHLALASELEAKINGNLLSYKMACKQGASNQDLRLTYKQELLKLVRQHPDFNKRFQEVEQQPTKKRKKEADTNRLLFDAACVLLPRDIENLTLMTTKPKAKATIKERKPLLELLQAMITYRNLEHYSFKKLVKIIVRDIYGDIDEKYLKFAVEAAKFGLSRKHFDEAIEIVEKPSKNWDYIPDVKISGSVIGKPEFAFETLPIGDPIAALLGHLSSCCQNIDGHSRKCVLQGMTSPFGRFVRIIKPHSDQPTYVAQSWVALSKKRELIFDSIEYNKGHSTEVIMKLYQIAAHQFLLMNPKISRVLFGVSENSPKKHGFSLVRPRKKYSSIIGYGEKGKVGYDSTRRRFLLAEQGKLDPDIVALFHSQPQISTSIIPEMTTDGLILASGTDTYVNPGNAIRGISLNIFDRALFYEKHPLAAKMMRRHKANPLMEEGFYSSEHRDHIGEYFIPFKAIKILIEEYIVKEKSFTHVILINNHIDKLQEQLSSLQLQEGENCFVGFITGVHAISAYIQKMDGELRCLLVDPENPDATAKDFKEVLISSCAGMRIAVSRAKLQVDFHSCSTFMITACKAFAKQGHQILKQVFSVSNEAEFPVEAENIHPILLKMGQKIDFSKLTSETLARTVSFKKGETLSQYLQRQMVVIGNKQFNAAAIRKKYSLLHKLETILAKKASGVLVSKL